MGWGDELVAAGQAQRLYDTDPSVRVGIYGRDGWSRWHATWDGNPIIATPDEIARGEQVQKLVSGPDCRPYIVYPFSEDTGWTFNTAFKCREYPARIYLTETERARGTQARATYGPYVLIEPYTKHVNFRWPLDRWNAVIAACPDLTFVQHMHADSVKCFGAYPEPATFREACGLIASAEAYIRSESGLCHAAAAFGIPQVTLFGGCMDADVMGGHPRQTCLVDRGPGSPCGRWHPCDHCRIAMEQITVEQVVQALRSCVPERQAA